ncbi:MAG: preprotein translocase subunit SecE [Chloroflexi bacterium]|nr:preprotein translocase subunit SecE [Chloroflexota bacterium]
MSRGWGDVVRQENRLFRFLRETRGELRRVVWPTRQEWTNLTVVVIVISVLMGFLLGLIDFVFNQFFTWLLGTT